MTKTKTLKTKTLKTKTLTIAKARKAAEAFEQIEDFRSCGYACYDYKAMEEMSITKVKAIFRAALGLPEDFRLTDKRMNDISDDLMSVHDSFTAYGQRISVALLADTLYTLKWQTAYAMPLKKSVTDGHLDLTTSR